MRTVLFCVGFWSLTNLLFFPILAFEPLEPICLTLRNAVQNNSNFTFDSLGMI